MQKVRQYAKAVVAVAGFLVVAGNAVANGHIDQAALVRTGEAALVALGVFAVPNGSA